MKIFTRIVVFSLIFSVNLSLIAQGQSSAPKNNFFEIQKAAQEKIKQLHVNINSGRSSASLTKEQKEEIHYKRWEWYWENRVDENGNFPPASHDFDEYQRYKSMHPDFYNNSKKISSDGRWKVIGPKSSVGGGAGRLNCIAFHPTDVNTIFVGSPSGGIWKSTTAGSSWVSLNDNLPSMGVSDIAIDPFNPNIMYIATGDGDKGSLWGLTGGFSGGDGDTKSVGVLKSTDGGYTWNITGLNWQVTNQKYLRRILINPLSPETLFVAASDGIYRTVNGGNSWTNVKPGYFMDLEFRPGDASVIYAASFSNAQVYRSVDNGNTWTLRTSFSGKSRIDLAVSPANPNFVGALLVNSSTRGFGGLYASTDGGITFTVKASTGVDIGTQGEYDLCYAVSPVNINIQQMAGVNALRSTNGGVTWGSNGFVHSDKHFMAFHPLNPTIVYQCSDGGLHKSTNSGSSWVDAMNGLAIMQFYRFSNAATNAGTVIAGAQDNGTKMYKTGTWSDAGGGDGMDCEFDYTNENNYYYSSQYGALRRRIGAASASIKPSAVGTAQGAWVTPIKLDPVNPSTIYCGFNDVYKSTNQGTSWTKISSGQGSTNNELRNLAICSGNTNYIYSSNETSLYKTGNGGTTWKKLSTSSYFGSNPITYILPHPYDTNIVWVSLSRISATRKVFKTINGGKTWINMTGSLPNVPANCLVFNKSDSLLFVGTDLGVFYRDTRDTSSSANWEPFGIDLPPVPVTELEIHYGSNKLRACTFGRGVWEVTLDCVSADPPSGDVTLPSSTVTVGDTAKFMLSSILSTDCKLMIDGKPYLTCDSVEHVFTYPGTHEIKYIVFNSCKSDTVTKTLIVDPCTSMPSGTMVLPSGTVYTGDSVSFTLTSSNVNSALLKINNKTYKAFSSIKHLFTSPGTYQIWYILSNLCDADTIKQTLVVTGCSVMPLGDITLPPGNVYFGDTIDIDLTSTNALSCSLYVDNKIYLTCSGISFVCDSVGSFPVKFVVTNHCGTDTIEKEFIVINETINSIYTIENNDFSISPNPFVNMSKIEYTLMKAVPVRVEILDLSGRMIKTILNTDQPSGTHKIELDTHEINLESGVYFIKLKAGDKEITKHLIKLK